MTASLLVEIDPPSLVAGSPPIADQYLVSLLFGEHEATLPVQYVLHWAKILGDRGEDFASHAATCHYWLYEHYRGYRHHTPDSPLTPQHSEERTTGAS